MRRNLLTLIVLLVLLALGGLAVYSNFSPAQFLGGYYLPTLSSDAKAAQTQALILVGGGAAVILLTIGLGTALAFAFNYTSRTGTLPHVAEEEAPARPGPKAAGQAPAIPLTDQRSLVIFWAVVTLLGVGLLVINYWDRPLGALPSLSEMARITVFKLPGEHIQGLPSLIAGPGDPVTALHLFVGATVGAVAATLVVGFVLARGFASLNQKAREAEKAPPAWPAQMLAAFEQRVSDWRQPQAPRAPPRPFDRLLLGLDVALLLVIAAIVAVWVIPSYTGVSAVDSAIEATKVAALVTPTPAATEAQASSGSQASDLQAWQAELAALPKGDPTAGQAVFNPGGAGGCGACHSLEPDKRIVGPSLAGVATRAATRKPGYSAELYIYESIVRPNAYVVEGFPADVMPQDFKQKLTSQQLADVIAFLMTLK